MRENLSDISESEKEFLRAQSFIYTAGKYFSGLGARPESFMDLEFRDQLPAVMAVIENTRHLIDWDKYLAAFSQITRKGWTMPERLVSTLPLDDVFESDLDHLIIAAKLVAKVYEPNVRGLTDENCAMKTKAILMILLHETDELIAGDKTPHEHDYHEAKNNAIKPAKKLLIEEYHADEVLVAIWEEFNAGETELAKHIDMLDHESAMRKGLKYDFEFKGRRDPVLLREFADYYVGKHRDDWFRNRVDMIVGQAGIMSERKDIGHSYILVLRKMWEDVKIWGEAVDCHVPDATRFLSKSILERFGCIIPEKAN